MEIVRTKDHSHTLRSEIWGDLYHSVHGAIQESKHVFIRQGLYKCMAKTEKIRIFEMGFGTGLNAFLSCLESIEKNLSIIYDSVESHPVDTAVINSLNYPDFLGDNTRSIFEKIHDAPWNSHMEITPQFFLHKYHTKLQDFIPESQYSCIYFDAFAPNTQSELWETSIFEKMFEMLEDGGFLVTYCAKGYVKRNLRSAGFEVIALPGPPGKREMTMARKN